MPCAGPLAAGCGTAAAGAGVGGAPLDTAATGAAVAAAGAPISWRAAAAKAQTNGPPNGTTGPPPESRLATDRIVDSSPEAALATALGGAATACGTAGATDFERGWTATKGPPTTGGDTEASTLEVAGSDAVTTLTAATAAVAEAATGCNDTTVVEASASTGDAATAGADDADGAGARFLPVLSTGEAPSATPLMAWRDALLPATLPELVELPPDNEPARVAFVLLLPADGAPAEAESSACAIPAPPPNRTAPIPRVNAAEPSHEYGWCAMGLRCRAWRPRELSKMFVAIGYVPVFIERRRRRGGDATRTAKTTEGPKATCADTSAAGPTGRVLRQAVPAPSAAPAMSTAARAKPKPRRLRAFPDIGEPDE